jgi:hypothetical protein
MEGVRVSSAFFNLAHESRRSKRREKILHPCMIVVLVVLIIAEHLQEDADVSCSWDCIPGMTFDDIGHRNGVFGIGEVCSKPILR